MSPPKREELPRRHQSSYGHSGGNHTAALEHERNSSLHHARMCDLVALLAAKDKKLDQSHRTIEALKEELARYEAKLAGYKEERDRFRIDINAVGQEVSV